MPLRKSPTRTPAMLAANRANALKSTGPRTARGKAQVALNRLKHGGYAVRLPEKLVQAGEQASDAQYRWFRSEIATTFGVGEQPDRRQAEQLAARAWCVARRPAWLGSKPECPLESMGKWLRLPSLSPSPIRIDDRWRRIGLVFWVQRARYWTLERQVRVMRGAEPFAPPPPGHQLEQRWRRRRFRLGRPGLWEQQELEERASRLGSR